MLGLTIPQAAATLAATVVGFNIGLFGESVVNGALVLILVSIVVGTLIVERTKSQVPVPAVATKHLGARILVTVEDPAQAPLGFTIGARVAAPDSGIVRGVLACSPTDAQMRARLLAQLSAAGFAAGVDTEPRLMVHNALAEGILNAALAEQASLVLIGQRSAEAASALGTSAEAVAAATPVPVAIVMGDLKNIKEVQLIRGENSRPGAAAANAALLAAEIAARVGGSNVVARNADGPAWAARLRPGQLCIAPATSWQLLASSDPPPGSAIIITLESGAPSQTVGERQLL
jgi:nucleotide-binding universal stress UspA family protein